MGALYGGIYKKRILPQENQHIKRSYFWRDLKKLDHEKWLIVNSLQIILLLNLYNVHYMVQFR